MEIIGLKEARKARKEKNTYSIFEITTTPGLAERIEYAIFDLRGNPIRVDSIKFHSNVRDRCYWHIISGKETAYFVNDYDLVKIQWKHACDPGVANLKYLESASRD